MATVTIEVGVDDEGRRQVMVVRYAILDDKPKRGVFTEALDAEIEAVKADVIAEMDRESKAYFERIFGTPDNPRVFVGLNTDAGVITESMLRRASGLFDDEEDT